MAQWAHRSWNGWNWRLRFTHECLHYPDHIISTPPKTPTPSLILPLISRPPFFPSLLALVRGPMLVWQTPSSYQLPSFFFFFFPRIIKLQYHKWSIQLSLQMPLSLYQSAFSFVIFRAVFSHEKEAAKREPGGPHKWIKLSLRASFQWRQVDKY